jgi:DNA replication and repair protein RecF
MADARGRGSSSRVKSLSIQAFRNFDELNLSLAPGINILYGDNAQGKTNLLEAIGLCATGRSARAGTDAELIRFGEQAAHVRLAFNKNETSGTIDMCLKRENAGIRKYFSLDRLPIRKWHELLGRLLVVMFSPEDLKLIKAGPAERRAFMDAEMSQLSPLYFSRLREYNRSLKQRNHVLKAIQKNRASPAELEIWDEQLVKYGRRIMASREEFINRIGPLTRNIHAGITGGRESLTVAYRPGIKNAGDYREVLTRGYARDIALGSTSYGVHKDDVLFEINAAHSRLYGSQGQQRTAALAVKLAEIELMRETAGTYPVLLLDDVLSELDEHRQKYLMEQIRPMQVILTCTGVEDLIRKELITLGDVNIMRMVNGKTVAY